MHNVCHTKMIGNKKDYRQNKPNSQVIYWSTRAFKSFYSEHNVYNEYICAFTNMFTSSVRGQWISGNFWRISFNTPCKQGRFAGEKFPQFLSEKLLIAPFLKDNFAWYRLVSWWVFFFYHFKYFTALCTCLHGLWRQVQCNFYCFSIGKVFLASGFFQKLSSLTVHTLAMICLGVDSGWGKLSSLIVHTLDMIRLGVDSGWGGVSSAWLSILWIWYAWV